MEVTLASSMVADPFGDVIRQIGLPEQPFPRQRRDRMDPR
jgi:hypothetical protein